MKSKLKSACYVCSFVEHTRLNCFPDSAHPEGILPFSYFFVTQRHEDKRQESKIQLQTRYADRSLVEEEL